MKYSVYVDKLNISEQVKKELKDTETCKLCLISFKSLRQILIN